MRALVLALCLLVASVAAARPAPLPSDQYDAEARIWLARAMVAEGGWTAERDHVAIAYVLARRWRAAQARSPGVRLVNVIRRYCAGLEPGRAQLTRRQRWLRSLTPMLEEPDGWPSEKASWARHRQVWAGVLARADAWSRGRLPDPCRGASWYWGGVMDLPRGRMYRVDCGATRNTFYGLKRQGGNDGRQEATEESPGG
jgi:hypothetical protein